MALRRLDACLSVPSLLPYKDLFRDERLCSSDESDDDVLEEDRVRRVPVYRSHVGTMLVEHVDKMYRQLRQDEAQKRAGRKPAKRITSTTKHATDSQRWPVGLPSDCVDELFMIKVGAKAVRALKLRDPILQNVPVLATSNV